MSGFIPKNDGDFNLFYKNYCQIVNLRTTGSTPAWTHIPASRITDLNNGYTVWYTAWNAFLADKTAVLRAGKNDAKKAGAIIIQVFTNEFIRYSLAVSDEDRRLLGVHIASGIRTPIQPPNTAPMVELIQLGPGMIGIIYRHLGGRKGSRPPGVTGARAYYGIFDDPPTDQRLLPASVWMTRCPTAITLRESDRGKRVYVALRWEIMKGGERNEGPWSVIVSEIIP